MFIHLTKITTANSTYPKVAVQWLNQALCFYQSFCWVDSEVLRNRHLRVAANRLEKAGMLKSRMVGNKRIYRANSAHPLFDDIHNLLLKHTGIDQVVERIVNKIGGMTEAWLVGSFAKEMDSPVIDILMIGDDIDQTYLTGLIEKVEEIINRRIRYLIVSCDEKDIHLTQCPEAFQLWEKID